MNSRTSKTRTNSSHTGRTRRCRRALAKHDPPRHAPSRPPGSSATRTFVEQGAQSLGDGEERRVVLEVRLPRAGEVDRLDADDPAGPLRQHDDAVGEEHGLRHRVGDEHHRRRQRLAQPGEQVAHVVAGDLVERRRTARPSAAAARRAPSPGRGRRAAASRPTARAGRRSAKSARPTSASRSAGERAASLVASRLTSSSRRALGATVRHGSSAGDCGTNPTRLATRATCGLAPSTSTMPALGSSRPPIRRSSVVLPLPAAPRTVTISPGATSRSISRSASRRPKNLVTPRTLIDADTSPRVWRSQHALPPIWASCRRTLSRSGRAVRTDSVMPDRRRMRSVRRRPVARSGALA